MASNLNANATQHADGPGVDAAAAAQVAGPVPIRRSARISNKVVKSTKGTCGKVAEHVSLSNRSYGPTSRSDDEHHDLGRASLPIKQPRGTVNDIIYVKDTVLEQYVRVTARGHAMEDNSVRILYQDEICHANPRLLVVLQLP